MTLLACLALLAPGFAWWVWLGEKDQDPLVSLAQIAGISLSVIILLAEVVFLLGGSFSFTGIGVILSLFIALAASGWVQHGVKLPPKFQRHLWIGMILFGLVIAWRLVQARNLLLPNWVDSQHHFLIVRVILEQGGLPETLSPYLPVPFYYHYGFHTAAALFTALSGLEIGDAMLVFGQVLNAAIGLSTYALGKTLWQDWRPAAAAALLVSFAVRMPAYYLSWGRYTLTTGMILLPLAMAAALTLLRKPHRKWGAGALGLLTAGVLLTHYFTAVLLAIFLVLLALVYLLPRWHKPLTALLGFSPVASGTALGLLMAAPWLIRVARFSRAKTGLGVNLPPSIGAMFGDAGRWQYISQLLGPESNLWLMLAAGIGLLLALVRLKAVPFGVWTLVMGILALPFGFSLHPFRADHFAIVLFLPVSLWAGWLFWQAGCWLEERLRRRWGSLTLLCLLVAGWSAWGFSLNSNIVNPVTVLVTSNDLAALNWVEDNTPENARFYINTAFWLNNVYRSVDGGGWLLPYTGRWSLVPTVFYGFSPQPGFASQVRDWGERASAITTCSEDFWTLVNEAHLDWIYLRKGTGSLQPEQLKECEGIRPAYANASVRIYTIDP